MMNENNRQIRLALRIVFRDDIGWMSSLMSVPERRLKMIVENDFPSTDVDIMLCEMACTEQQKYVKQRLGSIRRHIAGA